MSNSIVTFSSRVHYPLSNSFYSFRSIHSGDWPFVINSVVKSFDQLSSIQKSENSQKIIKNSKNTQAIQNFNYNQKLQNFVKRSFQTSFFSFENKLSDNKSENKIFEKATFNNPNTQLQINFPMTDQSGPKSYARRDFLVQIQEKYQAIWEQEKLYEVDAPTDVNPDERDPSEKYFVTFPYPYMNGKLHLGHAFSLTKAEFTARYQRMLGKKVLFPFGFHCTGMPISAAAKKLRLELENFGNPPVFPAPVEGEIVTRQWDILKGMNISDEEIPKFVDPLYWLDYFPPLAADSLKRFGSAIDFRRSFITTEKNPYYDAFIRWQFEQLYEKGYIGQGLRQTIFSPSDNQACADHDRSKGEGVKPKEFTIIKLQVKEPFPSVLEKFKGKNVYLGAATLRPETMYGQTNCWLKADGEYGVFEINDNDLYIISSRSALNLSYQNYSKKRGEPVRLATIKGRELFGTAIKAPYSAYDTVYVLPMNAVDMEKTTGVVTSVPSDSPDDYAAYMDIRNKPEYYEKEFGIKQDWVKNELIPIIDVPEFGDKAAEFLCKKYKVGSQNDRVGLAKAHDECYKLGFSTGILKVGNYSGKPVKDAKDLIKKEMIDSGLAIPYYEPEEIVVSRSGDVCVVALTHQWFLRYDMEEWTKEVSSFLDEDFKYYLKSTLTELKDTVEWLREWGCSREFGLGTKLPCDPQYLIESLSDSTIYMAYYTIAKHLQGGNLNGDKPGPANITPDKLTREVFDYIFHDTTYPENCGIPKETLDAMRQEFRYWYPVDLRVSAKDLIKNHLTMFLFNHIAIWGKKYAPRSIYANGYITVDGEKMSKSLGNFLTMDDVVTEFSSDAVRLSLADAGDSEGDANFEKGTANKSILRLYVFVDLVKEMIRAKNGEESSIKIRTGEKHHIDKVFESNVKHITAKTKEKFDNIFFKEGIQLGWYNLQTLLHDYQIEAENLKLNVHIDSIMEFIERQILILTPLCPHTMDYIWRELLNREGSICNQRFPQSEDYDIQLVREHQYLNETIDSFRTKLTKDERYFNINKITPKIGIAYIAETYLDWQITALRCLRTIYDEDKSLSDMKKIAKILNSNFTKKELNNVMSFVAMKRQEFEKDGISVLEESVPFNEYETLVQYSSHIASRLGIEEIKVFKTSESNIPDPMNRVQTAKPGYPGIVFVETL